MNAVVPFLNPIKDIRRTYRKNIRKLIKFENLTEGTKTAYLHEKERKSQYAERLLSVRFFKYLKHLWYGFATVPIILTS